MRAGIDTVNGPDLSCTNSFYVGNRAPLEPSRFIGLPVGSVEPQGWLREFLRRQRDGLCGHLNEIDIGLSKKDNAWLKESGKGRHGFQDVSYWLRGYIELAYLFKDPKMIAESQTWINAVLNHQRPNGDFGPDYTFLDDGSRDFWANMVMMHCLETYYEHSHDPRVIGLMTKYFQYHLSLPDDQLLTHYWQKMRGGDELYSIYWLYNRTGDPELLKVAEKIHRCTANWEIKNDLPNWHNVSIAQCFREPAEHYLQTHNPAELKATYEDFFEVRKRYGQVPGGMFGGDENCRPGFSDPRQAVETCGMVEQMLSDEFLMQMTGDPFWADHCETVAFNTFPAAMTPDLRALRYLTAPNLVVSDSKDHAPGFDNSGTFLRMNSMPPSDYRCCLHNHSQGWPYFNKNLWMATPDNGLLAALYSASEVNVKVGDGTLMRFVEETHYPFEDTIYFKFSADKTVSFPLYLRLPAWCQSPQVSINGTRVEFDFKSGKFLRIERAWKNGDVVMLQLPMHVSVQKWNDNHDSVSVNYGPLTFSLKIGERYDKIDSTNTALDKFRWASGADLSQWPAYEIYPTTPWNYGLVLDGQHPEKSFAVKHGAWPADNFPFSADAAPLTMEVKAKRISAWTLDRHGLCAVLQDSPVLSDDRMETVSLIPMGAARLRISAFPVIGAGFEAHQWIAPQKP